MSSSGSKPVSSKRSDIEAFAKQTLVEHDLFAIPVNPVALARRLGARVVHAVFSEPKYSGIVAHRSGATSILVKEGEHALRKRFTVAHELGHMLLHLGDGVEEVIDSDADFFRTHELETGGWTTHRRREFEANAFAAALLMPEELMRDVWSRLAEAQRTVSIMARIFQVSEEAMGFRMVQLGLAGE